MNNKKWFVYIHTNKYYIIQSKKTTTNQEMLPPVTTSINLEGVMLSEISLSEKDKYNMISLIYGIKNKTAITHTPTNHITTNSQIQRTGLLLLEMGWVECMKIAKRHKLPVIK